MSKQNNRKKWLTLILVSMAGGAIYILPYLRLTYYVPLQQATGTTNTQLGLLMSAYAITNFIFYFPGGWAADRFSSRKLITFSCVTTGLLGFYYATFPPFIMLVVIHMTFAITTIFTFWPTMIKVVRLLGDSKEQGRLFGFLEFGRGAISAILAFISVPLFAKLGAGILGLRGVIIFYSIALIFIGISIYFFLEDNDSSEDSSRVVIKDMFKVLKMPAVWLASILIFTGFSVFIGYGMVTPYLTEIFHMSELATANISVVRAYVLMSAGAILAGFIADKMGSRIKFMQYTFIGMMIFTSVYFFMPGKPKLLPIIIGNLIVLGMFIYANKALYFSTIDEVNVPKNITGIAAGFMSLVGYMPEMFLYTVNGNILDKNPGIAGYRYIFLVMIVLSLIGLFSATLLLKLNK